MESFVLLGYKGSQKNIIGQMLSARLSCPLIDMTKIIEESEKADTSEILDLRGQDYYERLLSYNIKNIPNKENVLILGDVDIKDEEFLRDLKSYGRFIYLKGSPETIYNNIKENNETVYNLNNNELSINVIEDRLKQIEHTYQKLANTTIEIDDKNITTIFKEVLGYYNMMTKLICHIYIK